MIYNWLSDGEVVGCDAPKSGEPLLLISSDVRYISVDMPIKQTRQIIKALPFAIEEQIANDVEMNHIVYLGKQGTAATALLIQHARLQSIVEKYNPVNLYDFAQLLPAKENTIVIAILDELACIMSSNGQGLTTPTAILPTIIERELQANTDLNEIRLYSKEQDQELVMAQLLGLVSNVVQMPISELRDHIAKKVSIQKNLNILTDQYAQKPKSKSNHFAKFKFPFAVASSIFIISILINWLQANSFNSQADAILQSSKVFYSSIFPDDNTSRMKKSFGEYLKETSGNTTTNTQTFSSLLGTISNVISKDNSLLIDSVRYASNKGALEINLTAVSIAQLDKLKKQLNEINLTTEIASANQDGDKIKGVIKVSNNG